MAEARFQPGVLYWWRRGAENAGSQWLELDPQSPPQLYAGTELFLLIYWVNTSAASLWGTVICNVVYPSGRQVTVSSTEEQPREAAPGNGCGVAFGPILLEEAGRYQGAFLLAVAGSREETPHVVDQAGPIDVAMAATPPISVGDILAPVLALAAAGVAVGVTLHVVKRTRR